MDIELRLFFFFLNCVYETKKALPMEPWLLPWGYCCNHPLGMEYGVAGEETGGVFVPSPLPWSSEYKGAVHTWSWDAMAKGARQHTI